MIRSSAVTIFLAILTAIHGSESLLKGEITFSNSKQTAQIQPLSQEPKIANIKNSLFEFVIIPEVESCGTLDKTHFQRDKNEPPVLAVMDLTTTQQLTCGMSNKISKIKEAGGYGLIIVTNDDTFSLNHCKMYDANSFFSGVMDQKNFQIMKNQKITPIFGSLTISPKDSNTKLLEVWTSSLNSASYDNMILVSKVFDKLTSLKENVEWRPRIASLGCTRGDNPNICSKADYVASCGCQGQFCSPQAHESTPKILVEQDIRQLLIFKQYSSKYFQYIKLFKDQCLASYVQHKYSDDCATNVMNKLEIDSYSINTAISNFIDRCAISSELPTISKTQLYTTLEKDKNAFANYGRYPLLLLNKQILEYKNQDDLAGQLCRKLSLQDEGCFEVSSKTVTSSTSIVFYVLLVVSLVAIGAGVVYFYRKKLKRDMNKQIKMQVSTAVEHYFALTDVK